MKFLLFFVLYIFCNGSVESGSIFCRSDEDCTGDLKCEGRVCVCPKGEVFDQDLSKCNPIANEDFTCNDDLQCIVWMKDNSYCRKTGSCSCKPNYSYLNGKCVRTKKLNEGCVTQDECYNYIYPLSMGCLDGKCKCNDGYYERGTYDCRPKMEDGTCLINSDCPPGEKCVKKKCSTDSLWISNLTDVVEVEDEEEEEEEEVDERAPGKGLPVCNTDDECAKQNAFCAVYGKCECNENYVYSKGKNTCIPAQGAKCSTDNDCKLLTNSKCLEGVCRCKEGFVNSPLNQKCVAAASTSTVIGDASCNVAADCGTFGPSAICNGAGTIKRCECKDSEEDLSYNYCVGNVESNCPDKCTSNTDCDFEKTHKKCMYNICVCDDDFGEDEGTCLPKLGGKCETGKCYGGNTVCKDDVCVCESGYTGEINGQCYPVISEDEPCVSNAQCSNLIENSYCDKNKKCECKENYKKENNTCWLNRVVGDKCTKVTDCRVTIEGNTVCLNNKCMCDYGYEKQGSQKCVKTNDATRTSMKMYLVLGAALMARRLF